jgi:hypothetical protein
VNGLGMNSIPMGIPSVVNSTGEAADGPHVKTFEVTSKCPGTCKPAVLIGDVRQDTKKNVLRELARIKTQSAFLVSL